MRNNVHVGPKQTQPIILPNRRFSDTSACLDFSYVDRAQVQRWLAVNDRHPLAVLSFGATAPAVGDCPVVSLDLPSLIAPAPVEVWSSAQPVHVLRKGSFWAAMNDDVAAGCLTVQESTDTPLERTTYDAYRRLLGELQDLGYQHIWRVWNYFPRINDLEGGLERYQQFCIGRHQALAETLTGFPASLPAATAVGTGAGPLHLLMLAGNRPARHLGNPRQVNAYEYPQNYGPRSPSFARATICRAEGKVHLFLAGTASVVGHASRHEGLPEEQTCETIENILALLHHADSMTGGDFSGARGRTLLKVYVRHPEHVPSITRALAGAAFSADHTIFLQGDLCRRELLVEIEGFITFH